MNKIYYTEGPASKEITKNLFLAGADGVRLTFSYSTPEYQLGRAQLIHSVTQSIDKEAFIIADLEGGGSRLGEIQSGEDDQSIPVDEGELLELVNEASIKIKDEKKLPIPDKTVFEALVSGDVLIIGDGNASLEVQKQNDGLFAKAQFKAVVEGRRGLFVQNDNYEPVCMTDKDWNDLDHIAKHEEYSAVAISFVSTDEDVQKVRDIIQNNGGSQQIIAKIETKQGVDNIDKICQSADQIMVARGDLAYALPWQEMPRAVDEIVGACNKQKTPFIMATQVAESMLHGNMMTRAEMTDLWHWKTEGMDGVLISRETAWGERPIETIKNVRTLLNVKIR